MYSTLEWCMNPVYVICVRVLEATVAYATLICTFYYYYYYYYQRIGRLVGLTTDRLRLTAVVVRSDRQLTVRPAQATTRTHMAYGS